MAPPPSRLPDIARPGVGIVLVTRWPVDDPIRQRAAAEAIVARWDRRPEGPLPISLNCYLSADGLEVLTYEQWAEGGAGPGAEPAGGSSPSLGIGGAIAGIGPPRPVAYRLYRSYVARGSARPLGCIVIVESAADGIEHAARWIDGMLDGAGDDEGDLDSGLISANFHISLDGSRLLNYAEWADEDAHRAFLGSASREELPAGVMRYGLFRGLDLSMQSGEAMPRP